MRTRTEPAGAAPALDGVDPAWSRRVRAVDTDGVQRTWHVLDNMATLGDADPAGTLLCVHGNPTWSYLWRHVLAGASAATPPWRAIAVDHLNMGLSERTGTVRRLATRVTDLGAVSAALGVTGPVITVGHDWGGVISLGWAQNHRDQLAGIVLTNTAVHQPQGAGIPLLMQFARVPVLRSAVTVATPVFLRSALATAHPALPRQIKSGYLAPYRGPHRRAAVGAFVKDIPLTPAHPSWAERVRIADGLESLGDVPVLLLWGPRDPVFREVYLRDLRRRFPHAAVHRFERAGHLVAEDADVAGAVLTWLAGLARAPGRPASTAAGSTGSTDAGSTGSTGSTGTGTGTGSTANTATGNTGTGNTAAAAADACSAACGPPLWAGLAERATDSGPAIVQPRGRGKRPRTVSWALLAKRVTQVAGGLVASGVRAGDRVVLLVPPGPDLAVVVYACLRIGAVMVVADAGLGLNGLHRAVRGADPAYIVGIDRALSAARALGWPGTRIAAGPGSRLLRRALGARLTVADLARRGAGHPLPPPPGPDREAAVVFTSGSTGPAKGVVYTYGQLAAARDVLLSAYPVGKDDKLVAAFAPFALFGPALGATSVVPDMDVTAPGTLTAAALADAVAAADANAVFASPAALANVARTADALDGDQRAALRGVRQLASAGAPVPLSLLTRMIELMPAATAHTPYGMTEVLPVTDVTLDELIEAGPGDGVLVGRPLPGVEVAVSPLDLAGAATGDLVAKPGVTGEIAVRAPHVKERYDQLWVTEHAASQPVGWHRTGDVGHLDTEGRLWVEGRLAHVLTTADGVLTPVGAEQRIAAVSGVTRAALVGIGPQGGQQAVAVLETTPVRRGRLAPAALAPAALAPAALAPAALAAAVRAAAGVELAAVLVVPALPTDVRHNAKIDRTRVARWAARVLAGGRGGAP